MRTGPAGLATFTAAGRGRSILALWIGWAVLMLAYQAFAPARLSPQRPDFATAWSATETGAHSHDGHPYLRGGFMDAQVAWDSEYYLSIATHGYDDPAMAAVARDADPGDPKPGPKGEHPDWISLNDAFFPAYPMAMRALAWPATVLGADPVAAATLAGVVISALGTLAAMLCLSDLAEDEAAGLTGDAGRAAFYLLVMPASFFLAQVYTEGLFLGLSFGALALLRRGRPGWAALLAVAATWTRATGVLLVIPLAWTWVEGGGPRRLAARPDRREVLSLLFIAAPTLAYLAWKAVLGRGFSIVEEHYFGRAAFALGASVQSWIDAVGLMTAGPPAARAYYAVEFGALGFGAVACIVQARSRPMLAFYGLAILGVAVTSGAALGMHRYILSLPALYLVPARWGRVAVFDRLWTLGNVLVMAVFALAFSADFWAG